MNLVDIFNEHKKRYPSLEIVIKDHNFILEKIMPLINNDQYYSTFYYRCTNCDVPIMCGFRFYYFGKIVFKKEHYIRLLSCSEEIIRNIIE